MSTKRKPQLGSNKPPRDLDTIAADIHGLERRNAFEIGELLIEAQDACERGQWMAWLDNEFDMSDRTAENYMAASRLKEKFETVSNLPLPCRVIYELGRDVNSEDLPAIIEALAEATKGRSKPIGVVDANNVIFLARQRREYGDYPDAALGAMAEVDGEPWAAQAIAALKEVRPTTEEAAAEIVDSFRRAHDAGADADADAGADGDEEAEPDARDPDDAADVNADDDGPTLSAEISRISSKVCDLNDDFYARLDAMRKERKLTDKDRKAIADALHRYASGLQGLAQDVLKAKAEPDARNSDDARAAARKPIKTLDEERDPTRFEQFKLPIDADKPPRTWMPRGGGTNDDLRGQSFRAYRGAWLEEGNHGDQGGGRCPACGNGKIRHVARGDGHRAV
jgi:hypothetical protein